MAAKGAAICRISNLGVMRSIHAQTGQRECEYILPASVDIWQSKTKLTTPESQKFFRRSSTFYFSPSYQGHKEFQVAIQRACQPLINQDL
jgi:hypothetical protein